MKSPQANLGGITGRSVVGLVAALAVLLGMPAWAQNPIFVQLTTEGVRLDSKQRVVLPPPRITDGMKGADQDRVLREIAGIYSRETFVLKSIAAPFVLDMRPQPGPGGGRTGWLISIYFVVHGSMEAIKDGNLLRDFISMAPARENRPGSEIRPLTTDELRKLGAAGASKAVGRESVYWFSVPVLDRVQLSGIARFSFAETAESLTYAFTLDARGASGGELSNHWRRIEDDDRATPRLEERHPYSGFGGYAKVTRLAEPADARFIECRLVLDEPSEWSRGARLLRSKLPIVVRDKVGDLRRALSKAGLK